MSFQRHRQEKCILYTDHFVLSNSLIFQSYRAYTEHLRYNNAEFVHNEIF